MRTDRNPRLLVASGGLRMTLFPIPVITIFWTGEIGMSLADVMLLQSIFGVTAVLVEFPSGYVADRMGYRRSLLVGAMLAVAGWTAYAVGETFAGMALAEVLLGAGFAFVSGADSALLFESLSERGAAAEYAGWEGRVRAAGQLAEAGSSAVGGWLYSIAPRLPFWLQVPVAVAGLAVGIALAEPPRRESGSGTEHPSHLRRAAGVLRFALLENRRLRAAMGLGVVLGMSTFLMVWLIQPWMQLRGIPTPWFGPIWAVAHVWLAAVSLSSAWILGRFGRNASLLLCCALVGASYAALAGIASPFAIVAYLGLMTVRGLQGPIRIAALQADAPSGDRASVLSLQALLFRLAFVVLGPPAGMLVDRFGMENALAAIGEMATLIGWLAWRGFVAAHREPAASRG